MVSQIQGKQHRHAAIAELLETRRVGSQRQLAALLAERGIQVNQATLSRDMRHLGVAKGPDGYSLPAGGVFAVAGPAALARAVREWMATAAQAANQVVLRTPPGGAQPLALAIDRAELEPVLGTVAGDDTVLVVAADEAGARALLEQLDRLANGRRA